MNQLLEDDAKRIAHALHDQTSQLLASAYLELSEIRRDTHSPAVREHAERISVQLDLIHEQLRRFSHELRPPLLDDLGLMPALRFLADGFQKRTGLDIKIEGPAADFVRFPQMVETALYRVVQEALNNITRHARAKHADIRIWTEDGSIYCEVGDDGIGFTPRERSTDTDGDGLGLLGIRERLATLHGDLRISSEPGSGTMLRIFIPLRMEP
jgi:signal transduction histidine kinase